MLGLEPIVIGLGGNIGTDPELVERFTRAREALAVLGPLRSAPLYRSAPVGPAQAMFLNTAVLVRVEDAQPSELIAVVLELERALGRERTREARWGPRRIDLDVLIWGTRTVRTPELEVPHPRLGERRFALAPAVELLGAAYEVPGLGSLGARLAAVAEQPLELLAAW